MRKITEKEEAILNNNKKSFDALRKVSIDCARFYEGEGSIGETFARLDINGIAYYNVDLSGIFNKASGEIEKNPSRVDYILSSMISDVRWELIKERGRSVERKEPNSAYVS